MLLKEETLLNASQARQAFFFFIYTHQVLMFFNLPKWLQKSIYQLVLSLSNKDHTETIFDEGKDLDKKLPL